MSSESFSWRRFFEEAGIPPSHVASYAEVFDENRMRKDMLAELNKEVLQDLGVVVMGDILAIQRLAKVYLARQQEKPKTLPTSNGAALVSLSSSPSLPTTTTTTASVSTTAVPSSSSHLPSPSSSSKPAPKPAPAVAIAAVVSAAAASAASSKHPRSGPPSLSSPSSLTTATTKKNASLSPAEPHTASLCSSIHPHHATHARSSSSTFSTAAIATPPGPRGGMAAGKSKAALAMEMAERAERDRKRKIQPPPSLGGVFSRVGAAMHSNPHGDEEEEEDGEGEGEGEGQEQETYDADEEGYGEQEEEQVFEEEEEEDGPRVQRQRTGLSSLTITKRASDIYASALLADVQAAIEREEQGGDIFSNLNFGGSVPSAGVLSRITGVLAAVSPTAAAQQAPRSDVFARLGDRRPAAGAAAAKGSVFSRLS